MAQAVANGTERSDTSYDLYIIIKVPTPVLKSAATRYDEPVADESLQGNTQELYERYPESLVKILQLPKLAKSCQGRQKHLYKTHNKCRELRLAMVYTAKVESVSEILSTLSISAIITWCASLLSI